MLILSLTYIAPLEQVDRHVEAHMAWIHHGYDQGGLFLASGRKNPRTGGSSWPGANAERWRHWSQPTRS